MTQPNSDSSGKWFIFAVLGVFILGGLGVAIAVNSGGGGEAGLGNLSAVAPVEVSGDALPPLPEGVNLTTPETDPAAGMKAPGLSGTDFQGEEVSIPDDGRPKVIYFLAHWCPHCQQEVPMVVSLGANGSKPDGLDVYGVSTAVNAARANYPPESWLVGENWEFPIVRDSENSDALVAFGGGGLPFAVYLDGDNKVLFRTAGALDAATTIEFWNQTAASAG